MLTAGMLGRNIESLRAMLL